MKTMLRGRLRLLLIAATVMLCGMPVHASAQTATPASDFSLQVTPSPLVLTAKPGATTTTDMTIRNQGTQSETLKFEVRQFSFNSATGKVTLAETPSQEYSRWLSFSTPNPTIPSGQVANEKISLSLPADSGFSYSFAIVISRKNNPTSTGGGRLLQGQVAVFGLVNVDRPGATRKLEITSMTTSKRLYEFLPAQVDVRFKNNGNTIVQPTGNVFIQRNSTSSSPLATLQVNAAGSYILPNTERTANITWNDGFPAYKNGSLSWGANVGKFRIGKYTAKLVAVYNDGQRDVPVEGEVSFWVFPWKTATFIVLLLVGLFFLLRWRNRRRTDKAVKKALAAAGKTPPQAHRK